MPGNPGAYMALRDKPDRCENASLTPEQKNSCYAESGAIFIGGLLIFAIILMFWCQRKS